MSIIPFDDRDGYIWLDGKIIPWRDAKVHVLTHALHYGSCVFEGQRAYGGVVFKLKEHSERLRKSGELLGFEVPYSVEELSQACVDALKANNLVDAYVRPVAWRGSEQMGVSAQQTKIHVAVAVWNWPAYYSMEDKLKGLNLTIADWKRPSPECAPTASKAAGLYMICTMSKHKAEAGGFADALMFDYRGQVAEATSANVFFIQDGKIHTPKPDCFLNGLTRQTVIELARKRGVEVIERAIMPNELEGFQQAFLTGSAAEISPVGKIADYNFEVGALTQTLMKDYDDLVNRRQV